MQVYPYNISNQGAPASPLAKTQVILRPLHPPELSNQGSPPCCVQAIARREVILEVFFTLPKLPLFVDVATFRSLQSQLGHSSTHLLSVLVATRLPPYPPC